MHYALRLKEGPFLKEKIRKLFSNVWTIPNMLTILRIILIPVFVVLFFKDLKKAALAVFIAASLTDTDGADCHGMPDGGGTPAAGGGDHCGH